METTLETTAIILAGGKSSRFGSDKSMLLWDKEPIVYHLVRECRKIADEVLIVSNCPNKFSITGVREISDYFTERGPLGGFHAGMHEARNDKVFFTACDMPLFNWQLAQNLLSMLDSETEAVLPVHGDKTEPLFSALFRPAALPLAESLLKADKRRLMGLFDGLKTRSVDCPDNDFRFNLNRQEDYQAFLAATAR